MLACATVHSKSKQLFSATLEKPLPKPRIHVGTGCYAEGFPNRCRHCDPAPCLFACLPGAIFRDPKTETVRIDQNKCINCASCAMACPFGVIRYHEEGTTAILGKCIAVKCDNCISRQEQGLVPACVEACKSGALTFEKVSDAMKRKTNQVACSVSSEIRNTELSSGFSLLNRIKKAQVELEMNNRQSP
jgi:carbon-monoxide dehydrogenase iron sulfur subunit